MEPAQDYKSTSDNILKNNPFSKQSHNLTIPGSLSSGNNIIIYFKFDFTVKCKILEKGIRMSKFKEELNKDSFYILSHYPSVRIQFKGWMDKLNQFLFAIYILLHH